MRMVEINVDFVKHGGNPRATHLCLIIVKLHFARNRINFCTPNTYLVQNRSWTATLAQFNKKTTKIAQLAHRKIHGTSVLLCGQKKKVPSKKNMAVHPLSTFTHAPKRSPTVPNAGNSIAFIGG
jgi:hypothetical protein